MPKSIRKYIRQEKARIRREVLEVKEQRELIKKLLSKFYKETVLLNKKIMKGGEKDGQAKEKKADEKSGK